jgi:hypothetical protein
MVDNGEWIEGTYGIRNPVSEKQLYRVGFYQSLVNINYFFAYMASYRMKISITFHFRNGKHIWFALS